MCCALSRLLISLASAGCVCWAKPNHGFFHCQQPDAIFFPSRPGAIPRRRRRSHSANGRRTRLDSGAILSIIKKRRVFKHSFCIASACVSRACILHLPRVDPVRSCHQRTCTLKNIFRQRRRLRVAQADLRKTAQEISGGATSFQKAMRRKTGSDCASGISGDDRIAIADRTEDGCLRNAANAADARSVVIAEVDFRMRRDEDLSRPGVCRGRNDSGRECGRNGMKLELRRLGDFSDRLPRAVRHRHPDRAAR